MLEKKVKFLTTAVIPETRNTTKYLFNFVTSEKKRPANIEE
jgi:hypothetical protein